MEFLKYALALIVGLGIGVVIGIIYRKKVAEQAIGSAEAEATRLINEAIRGGENKKKEMLLEAKDEIHRSRTEHEKEVKERRAELSKQERRLEQKETTLDKKTEAFERKEEELNKRLAKVTETQAQADELKNAQLKKLEEISNFLKSTAGVASTYSGTCDKLVVLLRKLAFDEDEIAKRKKRYDFADRCPRLY